MSTNLPDLLSNIKYPKYRTEADIMQSVKESIESQNMPAEQPADSQPTVPVNNEPGQPAYLQNALLFGSLGIPVELFLANTKECKVFEWQKSCTTDADKIIRRAKARPDYTNIALVAQAKPCGFCFLDDDGGLRALFEAAGHVMQKTRKHKSCSGNFHY